MSKTFSHAGVSRTGTVLKARWCNGADRVKALIKDGQGDIDIIELRHAMDKPSALAYLLSIDFDNGNTEVRGVLVAAATKYGVEGYVVEKVAKPRGRPAKAVDELSDADIAAMEAELAAAGVVSTMRTGDGVEDDVVENDVADEAVTALVVEDNRIGMPEKSMSPSAIRKRAARALAAAGRAA
jgi:hypothetical protein